METLSLRQLNRATLARQWLLERRDASALEALEHLVGLQAQTSPAPYFGLASRLERFTFPELSSLISERQAVRAVLLRGTLFLVTARDCEPLRALLQPAIERVMKANAAHRRGLEGVDVEQLRALTEQLLAGASLTPAALGEALQNKWPARAASGLAVGARTFANLVQPPPRGLWGVGGQATWTSARSFIAGVEPEPSSLETLVSRYLRAFGPASVKDAQVWSGLANLKPVFERLADQLRTFASEDGATLFDFEDAPRPSEKVHAPVRLVAPFDNLLLSYADRRRVISEPIRKRVFSAKNGLLPGVVLVDGWVGGTWTLEVERAACALELHLFESTTKVVRRELDDEVERLLSLASPPGAKRSVSIECD